MKTTLRVAAVAILAALIACGGPPPPRLERIYEGLSDKLPRIDPSILRGRRILIDPGHGGVFHGTVGPDSLEESMVNLGVSLYLWGLLDEAGAQVWLTRAIDRDFLTPSDSSLASDLQARVAMADSLMPDVFISIHHNAQPDRNPEYNEVETYYKAGDPASLDLAFAIHRHLMRNLGIAHGEVRQGNYYVLRNARVPAVLGESSYLTHPAVEKKLRLSAAQRLEAEAYFLGLLDYFSRGIPRVTATAPADSILESVPALAWSLRDDGGIGIDPDGIHLTVDGAPVVPWVADDASRVVYTLPWNAANRDYRAELTARNLLGNTSPITETRFRIDLPPATAVFDNVAPGPGGVGRVRARLLDVRGLPVRDGTPVAITTAPDTSRLETTVRNGRVDAAVRGRGAATRVTLACRGKQFTTELSPSAGAAVERPLVVVGGADRAPIRNATIEADSEFAASGAADGVYLVKTTPEHRRWTIRAPGYRPAVVAGAPADTVVLDPWFGGTLIGRRFVLDPEGGRGIDIGMGPLGLSASYVNLRVAQYLADFLRDAGARVMLTRTSEEVRTPEDIARATNRFHADRYIEIRHRALPSDSALVVQTYYFPGSATGQAMAGAIARDLGRRLGRPARPAQTLVTYPLQQTACPAVVIQFPSIGKVDEELRLDTASYQREQAYGTFAGILDHFAAPDSAGVVEASAGAPGWLVVLDDTWSLLTGPAGDAVFEHVAPGPHGVLFRRGRESAQREAIVGPSTPRVRVERR